MLDRNKTPQELVESNMIFATVFGADFTDISSEKILREAFNKKASELVNAAKSSIEPLQSLTEVLEVFHFSTLAGVMLQLKANKQYQNILNNAESGQSLTSMVLSQFKCDTEDEDDTSLYDSFSSSKYGDHVDFAKEIGNDFQYTGKAMRAMAMVSLLSFCSCKTNELANAYDTLVKYKPTNMLLSTSKEYGLIGRVKSNDSIFGDYEYSIPSTAKYKVEQDVSYKFGDVYKNKIIELFALPNMSIEDRSRIEELRDYYADVLCRFFFRLRLLNFPRVLNLIDAVNKNVDIDGKIDEDTLNNITPRECVNLLGNEAILSKTSIDVKTTWYTVNQGVKSFAILVKQFNLFSTHKQALLDETIS